MFKKYTVWLGGVFVALGLLAVAPAFAAGGPGGWGGMHGGPMMFHKGSGVFGTVASVSGGTITVNQMQRPNATTTPTVYAVDATNAKVMKNGTSSTVSAISVGDTLFVSGSVSGTTVTATVIRDGMRGLTGRDIGMGEMQGGMHGFATTTFPIQGNGQPVVGGTITAVNGNSVTITNASNVTYAIDVVSAKILKNGTTTTVSGLATGDSVVVQGSVNGTAVTASSVLDLGAASNAEMGMSGTPHAGGIFSFIGNFFKHIFGF